MNVDSFVSQALEQIGVGIVKAQGKPGITISPRPYMRDDTSNTAGDHLVDSSSQGVIVFVEFDLSVVVRSQVAGEAHVQLEVLSLDMGGAKIDGGIDHTRIQRVKFQVPVSFPSHDAKVNSP
jgi:hypothetical protein